MENQRGQIGIVLLLVSVVMLTVGISISSRTTSDVNISTSGELANRALDAAESGIEVALSQDLDTYNGLTSTPAPSNDNIGLVTTVNRRNTLEARVEQGYVASIDARGAAGSVRIQWAKEGTPEERASLAISVFRATSPNEVRRFYVGLLNVGDDASRNTNDGFQNSLPGTSPYFLRFDVPLIAQDEIVRIRPLYRDTDILVSGVGGAVLPTQQYVINSTAQSSLSKETKAIQVERSLPVAPAIFDYVLFSGTSITQ